MAFEKGVLDLGVYFASSDYNDAADQYCVVTSTGASVNGGIGFRKTATAGSFALGILQDRPSSGTPGNIRVSGVSKARLSTAHAAIVLGAKLTPSSNAGTLKRSTAVANYVFARALEAASSNSGRFISVLITHEGAGSSGGAAAG